MHRCCSLEGISCTANPSNVRHRTYAHNSPENATFPRKRRFMSSFGNVHEQYCITIRPKLLKSSSLSDLTRSPSEFTFDIFKQNELLTKETTEDLLSGSSGDATTLNRSRNQSSIAYMSWNFRGKTVNKKSKMIPGTYGKKFASDYMKDGDNFELPSCPDNSSTSTAQSIQMGATFPFKSTPSGNLKVQTNQVVFQSSTVGVLLADPAQAKVKVKFEDGENDDDTYEDENDLETTLQYNYEKGHLENNQTRVVSDRSTSKSKCRREDKGKDLASLGYTIAEPVDWMRVQLPKKRDLFQEFYRKIHNYLNTDTIIRIGHEEFHCHRIVLQIYSTFFDSYAISEIELPSTSVTPEAFETIYEWMIFSGPENNKVLKRDNILELFCAAQYLSIKDLEEQCWSFIVNENLFTEDTAFALFRKAREKGIKPVMELMIPRVMRFFLPLVASRDFLDLQLEEVMALLKSNYICVTSEIEVLMAGVRWLYGDWSSRRSLATDIMRCVRFGLISPWQLVDIKRNPDNAEILEIVNEPEIQHMVDDGLAYVIIKYWYGNNCKSYHHWIDVLGLNEPSERNWIGDEKNHVTYKDFLKYLEQFMVPKDQMYQQMSVMQPPRRNEDNIMPGNLRGMETDKLEMRKQRPDFPLPATLKAFSGEKEKPFPTMSEFFEDRKKGQGLKIFSPNRSPPTDVETNDGSRFSPEGRRQSEQNQLHTQDDVKFMTKHRNEEQQRIYVKSPPTHYNKQEQIHMCSVEYNRDRPGVSKRYEQYDPPEKDSTDELDTSRSEMISEVAETSVTEKIILLRSRIKDKKAKGLGDKLLNPKITHRTKRQRYQTHGRGERRHSIAATFLASATAALSESKPPETHSSSRPKAVHSSKHEPVEATQAAASKFLSPQISLFNESKESSAKLKMNKLSNSVLGPSNKVYNTEGSLFHWERETVLVFGGTNSQLPHGTNGKNTGQEIYRFDPMTNVWENVGKIPEPRHHHSVAFLRGRVYLIGGADPRDDDIRGKSVVVSTVWSFEPVTKSWYSETGLSIPRKDFGLVVHRMALYVIGGQDKRGRVLRSVERYDPKTNTWSEVKSMSVARMAAATAKYREYIWVAGGMTGEKKRPVCDVVECYNSNTNEWTEIYNLRFPRCFCTLFPMNDKLYLVGGAGKMTEKDKTASSVGAIDVWDWKQRQWLPHTEMSIPRHGHALAYLGTQLIIIGGITTIYTRVLNNVESFCCERDAWIRGVAPLPTPLFGHAAVTLPPASLM